MLSLAKKQEAIAPSLEYGRVTGQAGDFFTVAGAFGEYRVERAVSCLIAPHIGDEVLTALSGKGSCFILSVLRRREGTDTTNEMLFSGPVRMHVRDGGFDLAATAGVSLSSGAELALAAPQLNVHAGQARATMTRCSFVTGLFHGTIKEMKVVAGKVENIFQRLTERLTNSCRYVAEHEEIQTGSTRYLVEENLTMHAQNAMHVAKELVTINAEQIHLC